MKLSQSDPPVEIWLQLQMQLYLTLETKVRVARGTRRIRTPRAAQGQTSDPT